MKTTTRKTKIAKRKAGDPAFRHGRTVYAMVPMASGERLLAGKVVAHTGSLREVHVVFGHDEHAKTLSMELGKIMTGEDVERGLADGSIVPTERQHFVARAHFDLLRAIDEGAGHSLRTTPGVASLALETLVAIDEMDLAVVTPIGKKLLTILRPSVEGTALDHRRRGPRSIRQVVEILGL